MRDYRFEHAGSVPSGRVVFTVRNAGTVVHELVLVELPEDFPPIAQQLRSDERRGVDTLAAVRARAPGTRDTFGSDLSPGRYAFICFIQGADGVPHWQKGMTSELRVR